MTKEQLYLFDTTLRDGAQTKGVDFSVEDKRNIAEALDQLGVDYIEGGWPGANPTDTAFFRDPPKLSNAKFVAFGMTKRAGRSVSNDPGLSEVLNAETDAVCLVGKAWDFHVDLALGITNEENLISIRESIAGAVERGREGMFDAEHFFDGYRDNPEYAMACLEAAIEGGARWVVLCDTNGGTLPVDVERIVGEVVKKIPGEKIGIHAHNDTENAVANSLAAIKAGARQVQGTLNGLGERCGNANMMSVIPSVCLKPTYSDIVTTGINESHLRQLTSTSRLLDELLNRAPNRHQAYVGDSAFAHKGGLHVSAVQKDPKTYEHIEPERVGNRRHVLVSDQAGRSNILARMREVGIEVESDDNRVMRLLEDVKQREFEGYSYDGAEASFELMARRALGQVPDYFTVDRFRVMVERRYNARGKLVTISEATVKMIAGGQEKLTVGEGNGPVNALDMAIREGLLGLYDELSDLHLVDYKVRILNGGTEAVTRVLIESADASGERWFTVGVSPNIVEASFDALHDSITYKLYRDGAQVAPRAAAE
jgi:2-isopropylmalate synthase